VPDRAGPRRLVTAWGPTPPPPPPAAGPRWTNPPPVAGRVAGSYFAVMLGMPKMTANQAMRAQTLYRSAPLEVLL